MNINKKVLFPLFILFSALGLAGCAAYYSIIGIATLFSGAFISVCIMALFLEIGKICSVSFAYRYWDKCQKYLKVYLVIAILILMVITSAGISGMLMSAFQKSSMEYGITQEKITSVQDQKVYYKDKIDSAKKRIDDLIKIRNSQEQRMNEVFTNDFFSRNPLQLKQIQQQTVDLITETDKNIKEENQKVQTSIDDVHKIDEQVNELKLGTSSKKDIQTFKFVAESLNLPLETVAKWFILSIIFVFDPLAVCLILAYNVAVYKKDENNNLIQSSLNNSIVNLPETISTVNNEIKSPEIISSNNNIIEPVKSDDSIIEIKKEENQHPNDMSDWFKRMFKI